MDNISNYTESETNKAGKKIKKIKFNTKYSESKYFGEFSGDVPPQEGDELTYSIVEYYDSNNQLIERNVEIRTPHESEYDYSAYDFTQKFKDGKLFIQSAGFIDEGLRKFLRIKSEEYRKSKGKCYHGMQNSPQPEKGLTYMSLKGVYYDEAGLPILACASGYGVGYKGYLSNNNIAIHYNSSNQIDAIVEYHFSPVLTANLLPQSARITIFKKPLKTLDEYAEQKEKVVEKDIRLDIKGGLQALQIEDKNGFKSNLDEFLIQHCPELFENCSSLNPN